MAVSPEPPTGGTSRKMVAGLREKLIPCLRFVVDSGTVSVLLMPFCVQWAGSCWYYLRFVDPHNTQALYAKDAASWLPVDLYVGGQEHAVLHLLYARFWHKVLYDLGIVHTAEPFLKLVHQGMILGADNEKMSKSRGNVVNPDDIVKEFGADVLRLYEMFMGPLEAVKPWQTAQLAGVLRFRDRVFQLVQRLTAVAGRSEDASVSLLRRDFPATPRGQALQKAMHQVTKKVTGDIERMAFNSAISNLMVFSSALVTYASTEGNTGMPRPAIETLVLLLSPFAPHVSEHCWEMLGHSASLASEPWPLFDEQLCIESCCNLAIQVNGKTRGAIEVPVGATEQEVLAQIAAGKAPQLDKYLANKAFKKVFYVAGKIINIIV
jgi:leucyl-tRNA synthetase